MKPSHKILVSTGTYTTREGTEKKRWHRAGPAWEKDNGYSGKLETMPVNWDGSFLIVPDVEDDQPQQRGQQRQQRRGDDTSDVPFSDPYKGRRSSVV